MAKQTILTERGTGEVMYPQTLATLVQTADGGNVDEGLEKAKFALFVDMWNEAWKIDNVVYGKYDLDNAPDTQHPFMGNEIWMTYNEAIHTMNATQAAGAKQLNTATCLIAYNDQRTRTVRPIRLVSGSTANLWSFAANNTTIEVIMFLSSTSSYISDLKNAFWGCTKLRKIIGIISLSANTGLGGAFYNCPNLEYVQIKGLSNSINFKDSPRLTLAALRYGVDHAADTSSITITITVHPDVYAKLTGDTTNAAAAALTEEEAAQWQQVLADAVEKNISFATT